MSILSSIDTAARNMAPCLLALTLVVCSFIPLHIPGFYSFAPMVDVIVIYFWSIYRPQLMPQWFIFILGLFQDAIHGTPLGITSIHNLIVRTVAVMQRRVLLKGHFMWVWGGFCLFALGVSLWRWLLFMLIEGKYLWFEPLAIQWVLTVVLYPVLHWICSVFYNALPQRSSNA